MASIMPPMKESPAPTVSTTLTSLGVFVKRTPEEVTARLPCLPRVTTTREGPMPSQRSTTSSMQAPPVSQSMSSSETLTTSASAMKRSSEASAAAGSPMIEGRAFGSKKTSACSRPRVSASRTAEAPGSMIAEIEPASMI